MNWIKYYYLIILLILPMMIIGMSHSDELRTNKCNIVFNDTNSLHSVHSKLTFEPEKDFLQGYLHKANIAQEPYCSALCPKVDGLLFKVCRILPKCPSRQPLLTIDLIDDANKVRQKLILISPFQASPSNDLLEGFFSIGFNAIYISVKDFRTGVLAHEMTHYLLCQFSPIPDFDLQEKWAQYVDSIVSSQN